MNLQKQVLRNLTTVLSSTQGSCPQCKTFSLMQVQVHEKADAAEMQLQQRKNAHVWHHAAAAAAAAVAQTG